MRKYGCEKSHYNGITSVHKRHQAHLSYSFRRPKPMALEVETTIHDQYLEAQVSGAYELEEAMDGFPFLLAQCRHAKLTRLLINFKLVVGEGASSQKIIYAYEIEEHYRQHLSFGGEALRVA
jgi:hypothetical protein